MELESPILNMTDPSGVQLASGSFEDPAGAGKTDFETDATLLFVAHNYVFGEYLRDLLEF